MLQSSGPAKRAHQTMHAKVIRLQRSESSQAKCATSLWELDSPRLPVCPNKEGLACRYAQCGLMQGIPWMCISSGSTMYYACETRRVSVKKLAHLGGAMMEKDGGSHGSEQGEIAEELTSTICCQHKCAYFKSFTPLLLCNNPHESGLIRVPIHAKVPCVYYLSHGAIVACGLCVARFSLTACMTSFAVSFSAFTARRIFSSAIAAWRCSIACCCNWRCLCT